MLKNGNNLISSCGHPHLCRKDANYLLIDPNFETVLSVRKFAVIFAFCIRFHDWKMSVKIIQRVKIAHSFSHVQSCVKSVSLYHFKLAYVVLHMFVKATYENGEIGRFNLDRNFQPILNISCSVLLSWYPKL